MPFFSKRANGAYRLYGVGKKRLAMLTLFNAKRWLPNVYVWKQLDSREMLRVKYLICIRFKMQIRYFGPKIWLLQRTVFCKSNESEMHEFHSLSQIQTSLCNALNVVSLKQRAKICCIFKTKTKISYLSDNSTWSLKCTSLL